jgi:ArsR family transcriptional regulator, arsenate/arsenite/antimonite-responsive transcriptional repressor
VSVAVATEAQESISGNLFVEKHLVNSAQFHRISKALADPRRYEILRLIAGSDEAACADLRDRFPITPATLSHHLKELSNAGLIDVRREAKFMHIKLRRKLWKAYLAELSKV